MNLIRSMLQNFFSSIACVLLKRWKRRLYIRFLKPAIFFFYILCNILVLESYIFQRIMVVVYEETNSLYV